jgi:hypothetical protein
VFDSRVLRRISGLKASVVTECLRYLHNEDLHNPYSLPGIIRMIKSRKMRRARRLAQWVEKRSAYRILVERGKGKRPLEKSKTYVGG